MSLTHTWLSGSVALEPGTHLAQWLSGSVALEPDTHLAQWLSGSVAQWLSSLTHTWGHLLGSIGPAQNPLQQTEFLTTNPTKQPPNGSHLGMPGTIGPAAQEPQQHTKLFNKIK